MGFIKKKFEKENQIFVLYAVETFVPVCEEGLRFIAEIAKEIANVTGELRSRQFSLQRISVAI